MPWGDSLAPTDVIKDLFDLASKLYDQGWLGDKRIPRREFLDHLRKSMYAEQIKAKPKKRINKTELAAQMASGADKCVFVIYAKIDHAWIYIHAYFNPASANLENPSIQISEDGWITHPGFPNLKMGVYR